MEQNQLDPSEIKILKDAITAIGREVFTVIANNVDMTPIAKVGVSVPWETVEKLRDAMDVCKWGEQ